MSSNRKRKLSEDSAFFVGCKIYILPSALGQKRHGLLETQLKKYGGQVVAELKDQVVSHIVVDETILADPSNCFAVIKKAGRDLDAEAEVKVVGTLWLTKCLKEKQLIDTKDHELVISVASGLQCKETIVDSSENQPTSSGPGEQSTLVCEASQRQKPTLGTEKFACSQASALSSSGKQFNRVITDELQKLADAFRSSGDRWRSHGYEKAISAIKAYPKEITSYKEVESLQSIGQKMAAKVCEILESGKLRKVDEICGQDRMKAVELFTKVWGVGPATADAWYLQGCRTLEDLQTKVTLTKQQAICLKHYDEFQARIPREEVKKIGDVVRKVDEGRTARTQKSQF